MARDVERCGAVVESSVGTEDPPTPQERAERWDQKFYGAGRGTPGSADSCAHGRAGGPWSARAGAVAMVPVGGDGLVERRFEGRLIGPEKRRGSAQRERLPVEEEGAPAPD